MTWSIAEQIVQDNATGLRFEFDATDPNTSTLRVFTKERTRVLVMMFQRDGSLIKSDVRGVRDGQLEDVGQAAFQELHQDPAVADAAAKAAADLAAHGVEGKTVQEFKDEHRPSDDSDVEVQHGAAPSAPVTADELAAAEKIGEPAGDLDAAIAEEEHPTTRAQGVFYG